AHQTKVVLVDFEGSEPHRGHGPVDDRKLLSFAGAVVGDGQGVLGRHRIWYRLRVITSIRLASGALEHSGGRSVAAESGLSEAPRRSEGSNAICQKRGQGSEFKIPTLHAHLTFSG